MKRIKLIALDMDGTLLASDHATVPQRNIEAIQHAHACGVRVCISTGRMLEDASDFAHRLGLPVMISACNGTRVADAPLPEGRIFFRRMLEPGDALAVLDRLSGRGLMVNAFEDGRVSTLPSEARPEYHLAKRGLVRIDYGEDAVRAAAERGAMKLFVIGVPGEEEPIRLLKEELKAVFPRLQITHSAAYNIEIMPPNAGKGEALEQMARHLGITREEVMAVGDAQNDLSMLRYACHSVAMGNAEEEVLRACRYHTASNDDCGVARIIERVLESRGYRL